ncbi:MAG: hypothetical protein K8S27_00330 [Candidatus Omnitrophica bacterium]|nr:hypothetical protein [Candidatus Omnitrophota bacterium]
MRLAGIFFKRIQANKKNLTDTSACFLFGGYFFRPAERDGPMLVTVKSCVFNSHVNDPVKFIGLAGKMYSVIRSGSAKHERRAAYRSRYNFLHQ